MVPIIDTMLVTPGATVLLMLGPAFAGLLVALVAGVAWMAHGTAEELRRTTHHGWERRTITPPPALSRLAA